MLVAAGSMHAATTLLTASATVIAPVNVAQSFGSGVPALLSTSSGWVVVTVPSSQPQTPLTRLGAGGLVEGAAAAVASTAQVPSAVSGSGLLSGSLATSTTGTAGDCAAGCNERQRQITVAFN
jgi:hypothetical protein